MDYYEDNQSNVLQEYMKDYGSDDGCMLESEGEQGENESLPPARFESGFLKIAETGSDRSHKRKGTFDQFKSSKLNISDISAKLQSMQEAAHWCCRLLCFTWLTINLVFYCRQKYFLLEKAQDRRKWLEDRLAEMESYEKTRMVYAYYVENSNGEKVRCCQSAWDFAYGVSRITRTRASSRRGHTKPITSSPKKSKQRRSRLGFSDQELFVVAWLKQYAKEFGDQLPFGDFQEMEIRLPMGKKIMVYEAYCESIANDPSFLRRPISYSDFVALWKNRKDLSHIKCSKYKPGFSKCDDCSEYNKKKKKQMDSVQKEAAYLEFQTHIQQERLEKEQYYAARVKAQRHPERYMSIIIDSMDQRKTSVPFFLNPPKCLGSDYSLKNRVVGVIVHGFGTFLYWVTPQIKHDTNLTIECIRRTLLKYQMAKTSLPPVLYLQMDNASDNKSRQLFAFLAYLVEKNIFQKIKVSYLVVGHTHEDIDGYFSLISRFFKYTLTQVLTISAFILGLLSCSKIPPKCVEQIEYCYDCSILEPFVDKDLGRFNLKEYTGDKCHYFILWKDSTKGAVMQYKIYRYTQALYPRKYLPNHQYDFPEFGVGKVISTAPERDFISHEKFWVTKVAFFNPDGTEFEHVFHFPANENAIQIFTKSDSELPSEEHFKIAEFHPDFATERIEIENTVHRTILKCNFTPEEKNDWVKFFEAMPIHHTNIQRALPFVLPARKNDGKSVLYSRHRRPTQLAVDDGVREVDVMTHRQFTNTKRTKALKLAAQQSSDALEQLKAGDFVVLQVTVSNCNAYPFNFVIAQVNGDVSQLDTTNPETLVPFQIYRPATLSNLNSKLMHWIGDTNKPWRDKFPRGLVKALVQVQVKGKKLTSKSLELIKDKFF
jgi:hypothetical protein